MISIGIPTYNQADTLGATIESFLTQSVEPLEIVVSENWCTDHTQDVLKKYEGKVKVFRPERHLSMMENWNFLASHLKGEWFSLMSSDDRALPNFVEDISKGIEANSDAVLIRGPYEAIDANGNVLDRRTAKFAAKRRSFPSNFYEQIRGTKTSFAAFCVKKSAFEEVGRFDERFAYSGDYVLWLKLSPKGAFVTVGGCISQYRVDYRPSISDERFLALLNDAVILRTETILSIKDNVITRCMNSVPIFKRLKHLKRHKLGINSEKTLSAITSLSKCQVGVLGRLIGYWLNKFFRLRTIK